MKEIFVYNNPKSPVSESYRSIRTSLQFANVDKNIKTVLITSTTPGEGKTTTLCNLAAAMAMDGYKTLIVDCDMRKPRVHKAFSISNRKGLADQLLNEQPFDENIQHIEMLNVDVLTAGKIPANPSELLNTKAMMQLVQHFKETYDYIFFDTPPVAPVTDAVVMSKYIDGIILVISAGSVDYRLAKRAVESFQAVGAHIVGTILNKVPLDDPKTYQSYYYYYAKEEEKPGV